MSRNSIRKAYIGVSREEFLLRFFDLWNVLQVPDRRLTEKESRILTQFLLLPEKYRYSRLSTTGRRIVLGKVNAEGWKLSYQGLTQLVRSLGIKGVVIDDIDGQKKVLDSFEALIDKNRIEFNLEIYFKIDNTK